MRALYLVAALFLTSGAWAEDNTVRQLDVDALGRVVELRDLRGGLLVWKVTYDPLTALPVSETTYQDGEPRETSALAFRGRTLVQRKVLDADRQVRYTDTLFHWPDGTLRRLERDGSSGPLAEVAWSYGPGGHLGSAWIADEEARALGQHREWSREANITKESLLAGTQVLLTRVTEALAAGTSKETRTDLLADRVEVRLLDSRGRVSEQTVSVKGVVTETRRWTYDAQDRILTSSTDGAGSQEVWAYAYQDGTVVATLQENGVPVREELSRDGEKLSVSLYDHGELFLVETWDHGKKTKETYYQKGVVVRERSR